VKYGKRSLELYCAKHGYEFVWETEETKDGVYVEGDRDIPWYKIKLLQKCLDSSDADFIVWNDADSIIVNPDIKLEDIITEHLGDKDVLLAKDWLSTLNTGTMFLRNCDYTKALLQKIWDNTGEFDATLHEQASLGDLYTRNVFNTQERVVVLPLHLQNKFLSYWYSYYPEQCFIVHATRCSHDRMGFVHTLDMFCPLRMDEETKEQHLDRLSWMNSVERCRGDIKYYLDGEGVRRNLSARYMMFVEGRLTWEERK
jgi:hypothetical protein